MELLLGILDSLGVNSSYFIQFTTFIVVFFVLKFLFIDKLLFVLVERARLTEESSNQSSKLIQESEMIKNEYDQKIKAAKNEVLHNNKEQKDKIIKEYQNKVTAHEKEQEALLKQRIADIDSEYDQILKHLEQSKESSVEAITQKLVK